MCGKYVNRTPGAKPDVMFTLSDSVVNMVDSVDKSAVPKEHKLSLSAISAQSLAVFSQSSGMTVSFYSVFLQCHCVSTHGLLNCTFKIPSTFSGLLLRESH